jgi:hypothetical protein
MQEDSGPSGSSIFCKLVGGIDLLPETNMMQTSLSLSLSFNPVTTHAEEYQRSACCCDFVSQNEGNTAANLNPRDRFFTISLLLLSVSGSGLHLKAMATSLPPASCDIGATRIALLEHHIR